MIEYAFFYGDYTMLPSNQELLEAEELLSWNTNPILL